MTDADEGLLAEARTLDAADPLRDRLDAFLEAPGIPAYLDGNSLGRPLRDLPERMAEFVRHDWGTRLIRAWDEQWMTLPTRLGDRIGEVVLGAAAGQTVVADKRCCGNLAAAAGEDQVEGQPGLAAAGRAANENGAVADQHRRSMNRLVVTRAHVAGRRTTKRAPAIGVSPSPLVGPGRFSAQMRPRCASMICFEIDSPSPEFWPKP